MLVTAEAPAQRHHTEDVLVCHFELLQLADNADQVQNVILFEFRSVDGLLCELFPRNNYCISNPWHLWAFFLIITSHEQVFNQSSFENITRDVVRCKKSCDHDCTGNSADIDQPILDSINLAVVVVIGAIKKYFYLQKVIPFFVSKVVMRLFLGEESSELTTKEKIFHEPNVVLILQNVTFEENLRVQCCILDSVEIKLFYAGWNSLLR